MNLPTEKPKIIDLEQTEWKADIPNKREPFFGAGAIAMAITVIGAIPLIWLHSVLYSALTGYFSDWLQSLWR